MFSHVEFKKKIEIKYQYLAPRSESQNDVKPDFYLIPPKFFYTAFSIMHIFRQFSKIIRYTQVLYILQDQPDTTHRDLTSCRHFL